MSWQKSTSYCQREVRSKGDITIDKTLLQYAELLDQQDTLHHLRDRFYLQPGRIYMDGNSLGLLSQDAEAALLQTVDEWKSMGIGGWLSANPPWYYLGEELGRRQAVLMGAEPQEVVATGSTTVNLHALVSTFFQPKGRRCKILADELNFPSDIYALKSQLALRGLDPERHLLLVKSSDGRTLSEDEIVAAMTEDVALAVLPSVLYRSGQLLDLARLTKAAHDRGVVLGLDCSHSAGLIPHQLSAWGVDFAFWCTYKYLNSGPGGIGSLYVNKRHFNRVPGLAGWWGYEKQKQFDMALDYLPASSAGAWQIGTVPVLSAATLLGSLQLFEEVGMDRIRSKSLDLTDYLIYLVDHYLTGSPYHFAVGTPRQPERRGGHVTVEHADAYRICQALISRGVIPDFRPPNVIRLAPIALYTSFSEVWRVVQHLREIIDKQEHERLDTQRGIVS